MGSNYLQIFLKIFHRIRFCGHWTFDNGIKFHKYLISANELRSYKKNNLYEPSETGLVTDILKQFSGKEVFIDAGAGLGYYSLLAQKTAPGIEVHAFNPDRLLAKGMLKNMRLNKLNNVNVHIKALSDKNGFCNLDYPGRYGARTIDGNSVPAITLDDFLSEIHSDVYMLKIDVQGDEMKVLQGTKKSFSRIRFIVVSTHGDAIYQECAHLLLSSGFSISFTKPKLPDNDDGLIIAYR